MSSFTPGPNSLQSPKSARCDVVGHWNFQSENGLGALALNSPCLYWSGVETAGHSGRMHSIFFFDDCCLVFCVSLKLNLPLLLLRSIGWLCVCVESAGKFSGPSPPLGRHVYLQFLKRMVNGSHPRVETIWVSVPWNAFIIKDCAEYEPNKEKTMCCFAYNKTLTSRSHYTTCHSFES